MSVIPEKARRLVNQRDHFQCVRCGGRGAEWHHRRRRGVTGGHYAECPCNGILLCPMCHRYVHANPALARRSGWIVSSYEQEMFKVEVLSFRGSLLLDCDGNSVLANTPAAQLLATKWHGGTDEHEGGTTGRA